MQQLKTENILEYSVVLADKSQCLSVICEWIANDSPPRSFICANPHSLYEASKDKLFRLALLDADLVTPDGSGIVLASKILGGGIRNRITGSDIFWGLNEFLKDKQKTKHFFLGSTESTLEKIKEKMGVDYPHIDIVGTYSPPFKKEFDEGDNQAMVEAINAVTPDVLWVGLTAPKQEKWIYANKDKLDVNFIGAIGAVFDFYADNIKRSHPVFQRMGLEWLPRLLQEPKRLWRRNFISSPMFLLQVFKQKFTS